MLVILAAVGVRLAFGLSSSSAQRSGSATNTEPTRATAPITGDPIIGAPTPSDASARRKCFFLYYYFMDPEYGVIHVRLQTWFPLPIQVYLNGHEWLARKLARHGVRFTKRDNAIPLVVPRVEPSGRRPGWKVRGERRGDVLHLDLDTQRRRSWIVIILASDAAFAQYSHQRGPITGRYLCNEQPWSVRPWCACV